jgi:hypothetical protein
MGFLALRLLAQHRVVSMLAQHVGYLGKADCDAVSTQSHPKFMTPFLLSEVLIVGSTRRRRVGLFEQSQRFGRIFWSLRSHVKGV